MDKKLNVQIREDSVRENGVAKKLHYGHVEEADNLMPFADPCSYPNSPILARKYIGA